MFPEPTVLDAQDVTYGAVFLRFGPGWLTAPPNPGARLRGLGKGLVKPADRPYSSGEGSDGERPADDLNQPACPCHSWVAYWVGYYS